MKQYIRQFSVIMVSLFYLLVPVSAAAYGVTTTPLNQFADTSEQEACETLEAAGVGGCANPEGPSVMRLVRLAVNVLSVIAGVICVVTVIISGLKYMTSQGDSTKAASARQTLIYSIIGLIVVAAAQVIVNFVVTRAS